MFKTKSSSEMILILNISRILVKWINIYMNVKCELKQSKPSQMDGNSQITYYIRLVNPNSLTKKRRMMSLPHIHFYRPFLISILISVFSSKTSNLTDIKSRYVKLYYYSIFLFLPRVFTNLFLFNFICFPFDFSVNFTIPALFSFFRSIYFNLIWLSSICFNHSNRIHLCYCFRSVRETLIGIVDLTQIRTRWIRFWATFLSDLVKSYLQAFFNFQFGFSTCFMVDLS